VSPYVTFDPVEVSGDLPAPGGGFQRLDRLTAAQGRLFSTLDPSRIGPFIYVGNRFADVGATVPPRVGQGLSWSKLAGAVGRPRSQAGQAIAASAEVFTAEICQATGGQPAPVCGSAVVQDYASRLARFGARAAGCPIDGGAARRTAVARRAA
jgi:hypothetical protein